VAVNSLVYGKPTEKYSFLPTSTVMCFGASSVNTTGTSITQETFFTTVATTEAVETISER